MATTTNYGWTTPNDTDLVKDGASAIRTLGSSIDTTTKALNPSTTLGDIEYRSSTANTNTRLGIGTSGQVLTVSSGVPAWTTLASGGGMTLISETIASGNSSLSFGTIAGTYKQLVLVWNGVRHSATGSAFGLRFNNDSGTKYYVTGLQAAGTSFNINGTSQNHLGGFDGGSSTIYAFGDNTNLADATTDSMGYLILDNYASSSKSKAVRWNTNYYDNANGKYKAVNTTSYFNSTDQITSIDIVRLSGSATFSNQNNGTIRLYGVS